MSAGGKTVAGVEGSYCFGPMCVDKIAPIDLVAEAGLDFEAISRSNILFSNEAALSSMSVSLMNESGASVGQSTELTESSSGEFAYTIPSSVPAGDYYLSVFATFEEGGDVSYIFPISVK
jgi:hypothetical protein